MVKVWVNGTFDILHVGHIKMLQHAASFGSLTVGIDTDKRVKELKGNDRPFNTVENRKHMLESIKYVDNVSARDQNIKPIMTEVILLTTFLFFYLKKN